MNKRIIQSALLVLLTSSTFLLPCAAQTKKIEPVGKITDQDYDWWRKARFGIFIHWNTSSVLALGGGSWHRYPKPKEKTEASTNKTDYDTPFVLTDEIVKEYHVPWRMNPPREIYDNLFHVFNPVDFDAKAWAKTFKAAGAGYVVFTAKHHDGFCMFDSKFTKYNIMNTPFKRDICQELVDACAAENIKVLWYFSVADWYDTRFDRKNPKPYEDYLVAQIDELFSKSKNVAGVWWDRGGIKIDSDRISRTIRKYCDHPIANGRGIRMPGIRFDTPEQKLSSFNMKKPWESCVTMQGEGWFWNGSRNIMTPNTCIRLLTDAAGGDGNLLLDFGPTDKGTIPPAVQTNYLAIGKWLQKYGQTIRGTRGGPYTPNHWGVSTRQGNTIYLHITQQWSGGVLNLPPLPAKITNVNVLTGGDATVTQSPKGLHIKMDKKFHAQPSTIIALTIDKPALDLPVIRTPLEKSLTRDAKATASSEISKDGRGLALSVLEYSCEYDENGKPFKKKSEAYKKLVAEKPYFSLKRGHLWRYWMAKTDDKKPWIALDLGTPKTFQRINFFEKFNRIKRWELQIKKGDTWETIATGNELARLSIELPQPVTAQHIRLVISDYFSDTPNQGPGIREFDIFEK